jgi:hypothetical protein
MRRSTSVLVITFALLGILVWYSQQPDNRITSALATKTIAPATSRLFLIDPNDGPVELISITDVNGKTVTLDKSSGRWIVTLESEFPADQTKSESAAGQALNLRIIKEFDQAPDPAGLGLTQPVYTIQLGLANKSDITFSIGDITATGSGYYVKTRENKLFILSKSEVESLTRYFSTPPLLATATPVVTPETEAIKP